jgi:hypothetical protein
VLAKQKVLELLRLLLGSELVQVQAAQVAAQPLVMN